jgi:putative alpha-1,2-mannosidase
LDLAGAAFAAARVAAGCVAADFPGRRAAEAGRRIPASELEKIGARMTKRAALWRRYYDETTGLLVDSEYYEGTKWNYSFRLLHDMQGRVELAGGSERFVALLDRFFGYGAEPVVRAFDPADETTRAALYDCHRFCGYNNEPDIEAPYAYLWAGRHDRTAQVVRSVLRHNFTVGRGGLPGNDDSGGLSSAFVWNALGLFPVTGQPIVLIGSPCFREASMRVGEETLTISAPGAGDEAIYVRAATLNGVSLNRAWLTVDELTAGGELTFEMSATPTDFGAEVPPSYR